MVERYQNPVVGSEIRLRLFTYNSNNRADLSEVTSVEIYFLDPALKSEENPDGRRLIETITDVQREELGLYSITTTLAVDQYVIGNYIDVWNCTVGDQTVTITNLFQVYPSLWFAGTVPVHYDFNFSFRPNRIRKGSKRYLAIDVVPNMPNKDTLYSYYENLAIVSPIKISIKQQCGPCTPTEEDLRLVVDEAEVEYREKCKAFYFLDTTDWNTGIYDVWFTVELGESVYISETQQIEIAP